MSEGNVNYTVTPSFAIILGAKTKLLSSADHKIKLYLHTSLDGNTTQKKSLKLKASNCTATRPQATANLVFINKEKSHFMFDGSGVSGADDAT